MLLRHIWRKKYGKSRNIKTVCTESMIVCKNCQYKFENCCSSLKRYLEHRGKLTLLQFSLRKPCSPSRICKRKVVLKWTDYTCHSMTSCDAHYLTIISFVTVGCLLHQHLQSIELCYALRLYSVQSDVLNLSTEMTNLFSSQWLSTWGLWA